LKDRNNEGTDTCASGEFLFFKVQPYQQRQGKEGSDDSSLKEPLASNLMSN
jgi:hypothetical protein